MINAKILRCTEHKIKSYHRDKKLYPYIYSVAQNNEFKQQRIKKKFEQQRWRCNLKRAGSCVRLRNTSGSASASCRDGDIALGIVFTPVKVDAGADDDNDALTFAWLSTLLLTLLPLCPLPRSFRLSLLCSKIHRFHQPAPPPVIGL